MHLPILIAIALVGHAPGLIGLLIGTGLLVGMAVGSYQNLPAALIPAIQQNFLARWAEEGLDSELAYDAICEKSIINAGIGETLTQTRKGRKDPTGALTPLSASSINSNIDNGFSANYGGYSLEQWTFTIYPYGDTEDINLMQSSTMVLDDFEAKARNNGVEARQVMERLARVNLFNAYLSGNTYVRTDNGTNSGTNISVNDIRGFTTVLVQGVPTPVSGSATLACTLTKFAGTGSIAAVVSAAVADATNVSESPGGISGQLTVATLAGAYTAVAGDTLIANNAPAIFRPNAKTATCTLTSADLMTMQLLIAMKTRAALNAVPRLSDGTFLVITDEAVIQQLTADQQFQLLYQGRADSPVIETGFVIGVLGLTFVSTTESYVEPSSANNGALGSGAVGTNAAVLANSTSSTVRRAIMCGAGAIRKGTFEMLPKYLALGASPNHYIDVVDDVAQIIRPPLDRFAQLLTLSWFWGGAFATPTDATATSAIIPTASAALYKRAVVAEVVG